MPEEVVSGRSLEQIRLEVAQRVGCAPEEIQLEVLEKPGLLARQWKAKVVWPAALAGPAQNGVGAALGQDSPAQAGSKPRGGEGAAGRGGLSQCVWQEGKYALRLAPQVERIMPAPGAGELKINGLVKEQPTAVGPADVIEFVPYRVPGHLTWRIEVRDKGLLAVALVKHEQARRYMLPSAIPGAPVLDLSQQVRWEPIPPEGEYWDEARLEASLGEQKIVHGRKPHVWSEILAVNGQGEVVVAEATLPVPPEPAVLEDFTGNKPAAAAEPQRIDFFASKVVLVQEGAVLARKIPGKPGVPGMDVWGRALPVAPMKDFKFCLRKNVRLSPDGLEVVAACAGQPLRLDEVTYMVENVYVQHKDVDLESGSIEFPGDVLIGGSVQDGFHIYAGGKVEIRGSVSHAEIRAEKGVRIEHNALGGKIIVGLKHVIRSEILSHLRQLYEELFTALRETADLANSPAAAGLKQGQCLKLILEKRFPELPKLAAATEQYLAEHQDELVTEELMLAVRAAKRFLTGLGPLNEQAVPFLNRAEEVLHYFVDNLTVEVPENVACVIDYVQGTAIECGGNFECAKGVYNAQIRVDGDVKIEGVCRGGKIIAGGNVTIRELGGSEVSSTFVQISGTKRLKVKYCHPNVIIAVNKEIIRIEEAYKDLEVYRERGLVQVEKLKAHPQDF